MSVTSLVNFDPSSLLLKSEDVKRSFEKDWLLRLFAKHKEIPQSDVIQFIHKAQLTGANPMLDQIFLIERKVKVTEYGQPDRWEKRGTIVFSYQFLNAKANETGEFEGYKITTGPKERFNPFNPDQSKKELCSTCIVTRKGFEFSYDAWWSEYQQDNAQWRSKPYLMLEKCAFAGALRRGFPEALSGIYIEDEMKEEDFDLEIEKRMKNEAIDATASKVEDQVKSLEARLISPDEKEKKIALIEVIKGNMSYLTQGMDLQGKGSAMTIYLGVKRFDDLAEKPLEEIEFKNKTVQAVVDEKRLRESKIATPDESKSITPDKIENKKTDSPKGKKQEKPSFVIDGGQA